MLPKVLLINDPILRVPCELVAPDKLTSQEALLATMNEVMKGEQGAGLAANQIGFSKRIFILKEGDGYREYINPEFLSKEEPVKFEGEGCLSIPGTVATTTRFRKVKLSWFDKSGNKQESEFEDFAAFAVQHEMDHLDGRLYVDQLGQLKRDLVLTKHRKYMKMRSKR